MRDASRSMTRSALASCGSRARSPGWRAATSWSMRAPSGRSVATSRIWVAFAFDFTTQAETIDFVEGFGATYLGDDRI